MDRVQWLDHKGKQILFINEKDLNEEEILKAMDDAIEVLSSFSGKTLLIVTDVSGTHVTQRIHQKSKQTVGIPIQKGIKVISAIIGIQGMKKMLTAEISKEIHVAETLEEACDWLVAQVEAAS